MQMDSNSSDCVVLFSGGRDSTVAALRLVEEFPALTLLTVTTEHLIGIDFVVRRLQELSRLLPETVTWVHAVARPTSLVRIGEETIESCLPCHHVYLKTAMATARNRGTNRIALGYTAYQDTWLEQTPYAVEALRSVLAEFAITLLLPSANLKSKAEAVSVLRGKGLDAASMEQKCLKQQFNTKNISIVESIAEIDAWKIALRKSFQTAVLNDVDVREPVMLSEVVNAYDK